MIKVNVLVIRVPSERGLDQTFYDEVAYLQPYKIDTMTVVDGQHEKHHVPQKARTLIRYMDVLKGYRLIYVAEPAEVLDRQVSRELRGEGPPEYDLFGDGGDGGDGGGR